MSPPAPFVESALRPLTRVRGFEPVKLKWCAVGKAARVVQVVPEATPFAGALWAALSGSFRASAGENPEAPEGMVAVAPRGGGLVLRPSATSKPMWSSMLRRGAGGAVLRQGQHVLEHFVLTWDEEVCRFIDVRTGDIKWQSIWEFCHIARHTVLLEHVR